jgi:predicted dinucleotide-binding enzyme
MQIGVLGTGVVGRTLAEGLARIGNEVTIGTRDVDALLARDEPDQMGTPPFSAWHAEHQGIGLGTFAETGAAAELLVNATHGSASVEALTAAGADAVEGRIVIDVSNPLDFSHGFPPSLWVTNTDSLGEQIQRAFPAARVVKAWNMMTAALMTNPTALAGGDHTFVLCGDDADAKERVSEFLRALGWADIVDLGDITNARAMEAYLIMWTRMFGALDRPMYNIKVVR